jgi:tetratricopeptide (TPR) repeat protein
MVSNASFRDRYGLPLSTASQTAAERYVEGVDLLLSYNLGAEERLAEAATADEGFALPHAALALLCQQQGRVEDARAAAECARTLAAGTTPREQRHAEAIALAVGGEGGKALGVMREHLVAHPLDALLVFQAHSIIGFSGRPEREQERYGFLAQLAPVYGDDWWFLSAWSFVHHELERFEEARRLSERSLELYPRNAAASHNVAHVFYETDDHGSGADFLAGWLAGYDQGAPYHTHLSWHLALHHLAEGRYRQVMELYNTAISPTVSRNRITFFDASSLLWRWQMYGCSDGPLPWAEVCSMAGMIAPRPGMAFADMHAALTYAATGDDAAITRMIDGLRDLDAKGHPLAGPVMLPVVEGIHAFARGAYDTAITHLEPVAPQFHRIGGSHAQWEIVEEILAEAYLRDGRYEQAEALLRKRLDRRPSPRDLFWLGKAQAGCARSEAAATLAEARARWPHAERDNPEQAVLDAALATANAYQEQAQ